MNALRPLVLIGVLGSSLPSQETLWQVPASPSADILWDVAPFVDYDGDGYRDFLHHRQTNYATPGWSAAVQVCSGRDAAVLWENRSIFNARAVHAGDVNGDGRPEVAIVQGFSWTTVRYVDIWSPATNQLLWSQGGLSDLYGYSMVGGLDLDGDGRSELVVLNMGSASAAYIYNSNGTLRYVIPGQLYGGVAVSVGKLPDIDHDGHDDLLVGINDASFRGKVLVVSGFSGSIIRQHQGQQVGDKTCDFVRSLGDLDGDGVHDYAAFPWITASRAVVLVWSGATGNLIRTWDEFANSVITGEDFDRDGVPDLAIGADWQVPNAVGSTRVYSGRDGAELWRLDNVPFVPSNGGSTGSYGWMEYSAALGVQPGDAYPTIGWLDADWWQIGTVRGRVRAIRTNFIGQGTVRGRPCSSLPDVPPLIGVRRQPAAPTGQHPARITVAHGPAGAAAFLALGFPAPLPIRLDVFGLPGCALQVVPIATTLTTLGTNGLASGYGYVDLPNTFAPVTTGTRIAAQWLLLEPVTSSFGMSEVHELTLQ